MKLVWKKTCLEKKTKSELSHNERQFIESREKEISSILGAIEEAKRFNLGDILVASRTEYDHRMDLRTFINQAMGGNAAVKERVMKSIPIVTQQAGARIKYKVIYVDAHGLPYIKRIDLNGKPSGEMISIYKTRHDYDRNIVYELDPHFADALILGDADNYDPMKEYNDSVRVTKEVTEHNQVNKLDSREFLYDTIKSFKVGDTVWRSLTHNFTIMEKYSINSKLPVQSSSGCDQPAMKVQNTKGEILTLTVGDLHGKNLYRNQPRSLTKELKNLK